MWNNRTILVGNLVKEPVLKKANDISVCNFRIAVQRQSTDGSADFIDCLAWRQSADYICMYGHKGQKLSLEGHIQTRTYENDGIKRYITEIVVDNCHLDRKPTTEESFSNGEVITLKGDEEYY